MVLLSRFMDSPDLHVKSAREMLTPVEGIGIRGPCK
jgi:hypothetical protein